MLNFKNSIYVLVSKELIKEDHPNDKAKQKQILERVKEANRSRTTVVRKCVLNSMRIAMLSFRNTVQANLYRVHDLPLGSVVYSKN
jgi:hypothetical protein